MKKIYLFIAACVVSAMSLAQEPVFTASDLDFGTVDLTEASMGTATLHVEWANLPIYSQVEMAVVNVSDEDHCIFAVDELDTTFVWTGSGYPDGLKGEEIPIYGRIIGVADAFDAMTANRVYRKQMDFSYVLGELEKGRGTQFDAQFVDILLKLIRNGTIDMNKLYGVNPDEAETNPEETGPENRQQNTDAK